MSKSVKVLAVASEGGHWIQLMRLRPAFEGKSVTYVSTNSELASAFSLTNFYTLPDANLDKKIKLIWLLLRSLLLVISVRPTHIITTGAAPGFAVLVCGKLLGAKTIWIDSIANADELSSAGKKAGRFADHWLTQWEHLAALHKGLEYKGRVI